MKPEEALKEAEKKVGRDAKMELNLLFMNIWDFARKI